MDLKTRYVIKGIGKEQTIASKVMIFYDKSSGKITKVQDKWNGKLPESSFTNVSVDQLLSLWWWVHYSESWGWWVWSFTWEMRWWQVRALVYWSLGVVLVDNARACASYGWISCCLGTTMKVFADPVVLSFSET
jgi:hypothetical protein